MFKSRCQAVRVFQEQLLSFVGWLKDQESVQGEGCEFVLAFFKDPEYERRRIRFQGMVDALGLTPRQINSMIRQAEMKHLRQAAELADRFAHYPRIYD